MKETTAYEAFLVTVAGSDSLREAYERVSGSETTA